MNFWSCLTFSTWIFNFSDLFGSLQILLSLDRLITVDPPTLHLNCEISGNFSSELTSFLSIIDAIFSGDSSIESLDLSCSFLSSSSKDFGSSPWVFMVSYEIAETGMWLFENDCFLIQKWTVINMAFIGKRNLLNLLLRIFHRTRGHIGLFADFLVRIFLLSREEHVLEGLHHTLAGGAWKLVSSFSSFVCFKICLEEIYEDCFVGRWIL